MAGLWAMSAAVDPTTKLNPFNCTLGEFWERIDAQRVEDLPDMALYSLEEACAIQKKLGGARPFHQVATFAPPGWKRQNLLSPDEYLRNWPGSPDSPLEEFALIGPSRVDGIEIIAAGGAVSNSLYRKSSERPQYVLNRFMEPADRNWPSDIDYYPVLTDPAAKLSKSRDRTIIKDFCDRVADRASEYGRHDVEPLGLAAIRIQPGVTSVKIVTPRCVYQESQLITRGPYKTPGSVPAGYDLGSSAVLRRARGLGSKTGVAMTLAGLYSAVTCVEPLDLRRRSKSFGSRIGKYFERGKAIALNGINPKRVATELAAAGDEGLEIDLGDFVIHVLPLDQQGKDLEPNMWTARLEIKTGANSDYQVSGVDDLAALIKRHSFFGATTRAVLRHLRVLHEEGPEAAAKTPPVMFTMHNVEEPPERITYGMVVPRWKFDTFAHRTASAAQSRGNMTVSRGHLIRTLGLKPESVVALHQHLEDLWKQVPAYTRSITYGHYLEPFVSRLREILEEYADTPIDVWIRHEPGRQWTASLNPAIIDQSKWYGDWHAGDELCKVIMSVHGRAPVPQKIVVAPLDADVVEKTLEPTVVQPGQCAICLLAILPGQANTVTLQCGHSFCWTFNKRSGCHGYTQWFVEGHDNCPMCRNPAVSYPPRTGESPSPLIVPSYDYKAPEGALRLA